MKVSIIIPVYNVSDYVERCLNSVMAQTYTDLECVIVDDCTPDDSIEKCERIIAEYNGPINFIILHHEKNRGLSAARNTGIDAASGEYVYFLDSDDEITDECIKTLSEPLKIHMYDFVIGGFEKKGEGTAFPTELRLEGVVCGVKEIARSYYQELWYSMAWNKLCNATFLKKHALFFKEGLIHEDELWSAQLACTAESIFSINKTTYLYHVRKKSIMAEEDNEKWLCNMTKVLKYFYEFQEKNKIYIEEAEYIEKRIERIILWLMSLQNYSSYKQYSIIHSCDLRSWRTKNRVYKTRKTRLLMLDKYMPSFIGYRYKKIITTLLKCKKKIKHS